MQNLRRQLLRTQRRLAKLLLSNARAKNWHQGEKTFAQKRREKTKPPADDAGDKQPPGGDDQPWEIYHYRPIGTVSPTLVYDSEDRGLRLNDLEPTFTLDLQHTKWEYVHGMKAKVVCESVQFLQVDKRKVRNVRAEQIERTVGTKTSVFKAPHPCLLKEGHADPGINPSQQEWGVPSWIFPRNENREACGKGYHAGANHGSE